MTLTKREATLEFYEMYKGRTLEEYIKLYKTELAHSDDLTNNILLANTSMSIDKLFGIFGSIHLALYANSIDETNKISYSYCVASPKTLGIVINKGAGNDKEIRLLDYKGITEGKECKTYDMLTVPPGIFQHENSELDYLNELDPKTINYDSYGAALTFVLLLKNNASGTINDNKYQIPSDITAYFSTDTDLTTKALNLLKNALNTDNQNAEIKTIEQIYIDFNKAAEYKYYMSKDVEFKDFHTELEMRKIKQIYLSKVKNPFYIIIYFMIISNNIAPLKNQQKYLLYLN